jgi:hypothetical protein
MTLHRDRSRLDNEMQVVGEMLSWFVKSFGDILTNLIAAAIGGIIVWLRIEGRRLIDRHKARKFWRAMATSQSIAVIADHDREAHDDWEPSGLVGLQDVLAFLAVRDQFRKTGVTLTVRDDNDFPRDGWRANLVLIGGPDVNRVAAGILDAAESTLPLIFPGWRNHQVTLHDKAEGKNYSPQRIGGKVVTDFGIVTRIRNPFGSHGEQVVHIAGCFGYGSMGAAMALERAELLNNPIVRSGTPFQALIETRVIDDIPHFSRLVCVRTVMSQHSQVSGPPTT